MAMILTQRFIWAARTIGFHDARTLTKTKATKSGALRNILRCTTARRCLSSGQDAVMAKEKEQEEEVKVSVPLCERPATFETCSDDILKWKAWAQEVSRSVGTKYLEEDGGPDADELLKEVEWLLEDAVEGYSPDMRSQLSMNLGALTATAESPMNVRARVRTEEMYGMWKERVEGRRPFQYVVGCSHWRDIVIAVQEGVLIPRPVTENLIDLSSDAISVHPSLAHGVWADLGTGSGALAIGLALLLKPYPDSRVVAVDLSPVAIAVARYNVNRYNLQGKVDVRKGSWFLPLQEFNGKLAGMLSNPPYIPASEISGLQAEVGKHEPKLALDGGAEGIDDLLHLCGQCASALRSGGFLGLETNGGKQAEAVADFLSGSLKNSFRDVKVVADYGGIPRFVTAYRS